MGRDIVRGSSRYPLAVVAGSISLLLAVAGVSLAGAAGNPDPLFSGRTLSPGSSVSAQIEVAARPSARQPYLEVRDTHDTCVAQCQIARAPLSDLVTLSVTAPDHTTWTRSLRALSQPVPLPGGALRTPAAPTHYLLQLTLPRSTGNLGEGLATDLDLQWGLLDQRGRPVTRVLGGTVERGSGSPGQRLLPDTGYDVALVLLAGLGCGCSGVVLVLAGRSRRRGRWVDSA